MRLTHILFLGLMSASWAMAGESVSQVVLSAEQKQALLTSMQAEIQTHQNMQLTQIQSDLNKRLALIQSHLSAPQNQAMITQINELQTALGSQDKDSIIALEMMQLQQTQASDNLQLLPFFVFTQDDIASIEDPKTAGWMDVLDTLWFPAAVAIDVLLIPWSIFIACSSGI